MLRVIIPVVLGIMMPQILKCFFYWVVRKPVTTIVTIVLGVTLLFGFAVERSWIDSGDFCTEIEDMTAGAVNSITKKTDDTIETINFLKEGKTIF